MSDFFWFLALIIAGCSLYLMFGPKDPPNVA